MNAKDKYPYLVCIKNQTTFACAGVYETWKDKSTGETRETYGIVTTNANPLMSKIYNTKMRMPLMYIKAEMYEWIKPNLTDEQKSLH